MITRIMGTIVNGLKGIEQIKNTVEGNQVANNTIMLKDFNLELSQTLEDLVLTNFGTLKEVPTNLVKPNNFQSLETMKIFFSSLSNPTSNTDFKEFINEINKTLKLLESYSCLQFQNSIYYPLECSSDAAELKIQRLVTLILIFGTSVINMIFNSDLSLLFETLDNSWNTTSLFNKEKMDLGLLKKLFEAKKITSSIKILQSEIENTKDVTIKNNLEGFLSQLMNRYFLYLGSNQNLTLGKKYLNATNLSGKNAVVEDFIKLVNTTKNDFSNCYQFPRGLNSEARKLFMEEVVKLDDKQKLVLSQLKFEKVLNFTNNVVRELFENKNISPLAIPNYSNKQQQSVRHILPDDLEILISKFKQNDIFLDSMLFVCPDQKDALFDSLFQQFTLEEILTMFNYSGMSCKDKIKQKYEIDKLKKKDFLTKSIQSEGSHKQVKSLISKIFINFLKTYTYLSQYNNLLEINKTENRNGKIVNFLNALQKPKEDFTGIETIYAQFEEKENQIKNQINNQ